ncbi:putative ribonuclease H-like domain-containing protein [Tanacetum coccineum]
MSVRMGVNAGVGGVGARRAEGRGELFAGCGYGEGAVGAFEGMGGGVGEGVIRAGGWDGRGGGCGGNACGCGGWGPRVDGGGGGVSCVGEVEGGWGWCGLDGGGGQEEGIDYDEVFAPVARIEAITIFLAFASYMGFIVYQIDVKSAFLYGTIDEEVYVSQPLSFVDPKFPKKVYKVVKALYGLHQAPRAWYATLSTFLLKSRYRRGTIDKTLFIKKDKIDIMLVQMSSMGELTFFLGLQVKQKEDGIFISQDKHVAEILKKFDFANVKTASTPVETQKPLTKDEEAADVDVNLYRSMIGSLMYLTASRPDIMFAVCACSRFQVTQKTSHLNVVKRIFRYLKGKPKLGLWYPRVSSFDLEAYSDSDYARANLDRKSTTGGCQFLDKRLISWQCKKQTIMATSTTEAEYVAAANYCGQVLWIQNQMLDYGFNFMNTKIYIDNESTICIVRNLVFHSKTKHIKIRHHFIRDAYEKKLIHVLKIHTNDNVADLLTKAFDVSRHQELASLEQTASGKDFLNPLIVDSLLKTIWLSMHHVIAMKHWSNDPPLSRGYTLGSGEDSLKLMELMEFNLDQLSIHQMATLEFCDKHTMVAYLEKPEGSAEFHHIIDFLTASHIHYALLENPTIYASFIKQFWTTATASTNVYGEVKLTVSIDGQAKTITEASLRRHLKLEDDGGITSLPNTEIFEKLALMGYATDSDKLTFQKVFSNMKRVTRGYFGDDIPLFPSMITTPESSPSRITSSPSLSPQHTPVNAPSTSPPIIPETTPTADEPAPMPHESPL